jgi:asparaginyl-tRNA synthetase
MIEPEVAFNDLNDNMDLAEDLFSTSLNTLDKCQDDLKFLETRLLDENQNHRRKRNAFIGKIKLVLETISNAFPTLKQLIS